MSVHSMPTHAHKRFVTALITALVTALSVVALGPVPQASAVPPVLSFVAASNGTATNDRTTHVVKVPLAVVPGDTMLLFITTNSTATLTGPSGWTLLQSQDGTSTRGRAWTKQATDADASEDEEADNDVNVTVTSSALTKSTMSLAAYRSSQPGSSIVTASASAVRNTSSTTHTAPDVAVAQPGSWLVNSWSEKSSTASTWTKPANSTQRNSFSSTGGGKVSSVLADSNGAVLVSPPNAAGRVATTSVAGSGSQLFSVVVSPGTDNTVPANQPPVASFTSACTGLTCSFNASASTDHDNDPSPTPGTTVTAPPAEASLRLQKRTQPPAPAPSP